MSARAPARTFQDLLVWQKAHQFVLAYGRNEALMPMLEETSRLPDAYAKAILTSDS